MSFKLDERLCYELVKEEPHEATMNRGLKNRHLQMMALGSAIRYANITDGPVREIVDAEP